MKRLLVCGFAAFALASLADGTVSLNPAEAGGRLVQTEAITGAVDVWANDAAAGAVGTVVLDAANTYTGTTYLPTGTLETTSLDLKGAAQSLGVNGPLFLGHSGVFRYAGTAPATTDLTFTNNAPSWVTDSSNKMPLNFANVFDLRQDVTFAKPIWSGWTAFVKTGPGAMILKGGTSKVNMGLNNSNVARKNNTKRLILPADGTGPTQGYCGFTLAQGAVILDGGSLTIGATHGAYATIGGWTADVGDQEPDVLYLQNSGTTSCSASLVVGACHGFTDNTPNGPATTRLVLNGGTFGIAGGKSMYLGPNEAPSGKAYHAKTLLEIHGGTLNASSTSPGLQLYALPGTDTSIWIDDGTLNAVGKSGGFKTSVGTAQTNVGRQRITVCTNGTFNTTLGWTGAASKNYCPLEMDVFDGGRFNFNVMTNAYPRTGSNPSRTVTTLRVDGGTLGSYSAFDYRVGTNWLAGAGFDVSVGAKGLTLANRHRGYRRVLAAIRTADDVAVDGGVVVSNIANGVIEYAAPMAYRGPTRVVGGYLAFGANGALPAAADAVTLTDGGLLTHAASHAVGTLTLGAADTATNPRLKVSAGASIIVTKALEVLGSPSLSVSLVDADGADVSESLTGVTVLTVPLAAKPALEALPVVYDRSCASIGYNPRVTVSGDTCSLVMDFASVKRIAAVWTNPNGGDWSDGANWEGGEVPWSAPGVTVTFKTASAGTNTAVRLAGTTTLADVSFENASPGYRITGGKLVFDNGGQGCGVSCTSSRNRIDSDLDLREDLSVTGSTASARRLTLGGRQTGAGRILLPSTVRFVFAGTGFAPSSESVVLNNAGTGYFYVPSSDAVDADDRYARIGGVTMTGSGAMTYNSEGGNLVVTNGIRLAETIASQTFSVGNYEGSLVFGLETDAVGEGPFSRFATFSAAALVRFDSGVFSYSSFLNGGGRGSLAFNGGTLRLRCADTTAKILPGTFPAVSLGARGMVIDFSEFAQPARRLVPDSTYAAALGQAFTRDDALAADAPDGGITLQGRGRAALTAGFGGDWNGPFAVKPEAGILVGADGLAVAHLVLGETDATALAELGVLADATGPGLVVSNAFEVFSDVRCAVYATAQATEPTYADGTYALVTYPSTVSDPDLSRFKGEERVLGTHASFSLETVAEGAYAGWRQVRMSVQAGPAHADGTWSATSAGGAWTDAASWGGQTPPNAVDAYAVFGSAGQANVAVTRASPQTVGILDFTAPADKAFGYVFSGSPLVLATTVAGTGRISLSNGKVDLGEVEVVSDVAVLTGSTDASLEAKLTGTGRVTVNADRYKSGGTQKFDTSAFEGRLTTGSGLTSVNDLGFVQGVGDLVLSTGALYYTGDDDEIAGFTVDGNANYAYTSAFVNVPTGKTLAIRGAESAGKCGFSMRGNGTLRLKGNGTFVFGTQNVNSSSGSDAKDTVTGVGDGPRSAVRAFNVANGAVVIGTAGDPDDAPTVRAGGDFTLATASSLTSLAMPSLTMNNGTFSGGIFYAAYKSALKTTTPVTIDINGGVSTFTGSLLVQEPYSPTVMRINGGSFSASNCYASKPKGGYGRFELQMNGGTAHFNAVSLTSADYDSCDPMSLVINGGVFTCAGAFNFGNGANPKGVTVRTTGGEFRYGSMTVTATSFTAGKPKFYLGGGLVKPLAAATVDMPNVETYASTNATTFSTAAYESGDYEFAQPIAHDPALGETPDGGLVKVGPNDLVLSAANTFTGPLVVGEGRVRLSDGGALAGGLVLSNTTVVASDLAVTSLGGEGTVDGSVTTAALAPSRTDAAAFAVTGDLTLGDPLVVDLAAVDVRSLLGVPVPLCQISGTVGDLPAKVKVVNANLKWKAFGELSVADGQLSITLRHKGVMILVR